MDLQNALNENTSLKGEMDNMENAGKIGFKKERNLCEDRINSR